MSPNDVATDQNWIRCRIRGSIGVVTEDPAIEFALPGKSYKFNFFEDNKEDFNGLDGKGGPLSLIRVIHKIYDLYLPHEAVNLEIDLDLVIEKYKRRIETI